MFRINGLILNCYCILFGSVTPHIRDGKEPLSQDELRILLDKGKFLSKLSLTSMLLLLVVILGGIFFIMIRVRKLKKLREKNLNITSEMTDQEIETLYGDDLPEEMTSLDRMSRKEMKIIAEKELEKEGRKPGEIEYTKGPLDWDDVDDDFQPRPKVIRSDLSKDIEPDLNENDESKKSDD